MRHPIKIRQRSDRFAARVHIGLRLAKPDPLSAWFSSRNSRLELLFVIPSRPPALGQTLYHQKTDIVPGPCVLGAGIAQPDDEMDVLHAQAMAGSPAATG